MQYSFIKVGPKIEWYAVDERGWLAQQVRLGPDAALLAGGLPDGAGAAAVIPSPRMKFFKTKISKRKAELE